MLLSLQCLATLIIMLVGDTYTLINYVSFINYLCYGVTIMGLIVLRWKKPKIFRPIKVTLSKLNFLVAIVVQRVGWEHLPKCHEWKRRIHRQLSCCHGQRGQEQQKEGGTAGGAGACTPAQPATAAAVHSPALSALSC